MASNNSGQQSIEYVAACPGCGRDASWRTTDRAVAHESERFNNISCDHCDQQPKTPWVPTLRR